MTQTDNFYLGQYFDPKVGKNTGERFLFDPADLTTHAVVVGMTGSGKTGLCLTLLEEAALQGIPALMIDPKGDITNALLHFPDLNPADFLPWINPDQARREGKSIEQAAADAADRWRSGLSEWGISPERLLALKNAAEFAVYTPGSDAGFPVSILASLRCPPLPWETNRELLREKISGAVTALLGLVGFTDIDPVRTREHILLANIFENAWKQGKDLDLSELILQTQTPPFARLGVFDVNTFFPEKDRFTLAMQLNNILAAPAFQTWLEGQSLDIPALLHTADGRPRHSIFYLAHLSEAERMFFVTLLYSAIESWMRAQPGSAGLRAIVYFDEIFGYLPPVNNPPSKPLLLRMLKQARAFGVGQVLVTQNPVDVDYKALSNAGAWFIGKLQTEQDKLRLLDGLESAQPGGLNRAAYDRLISSLGKRVFLLHNVHAPRDQSGRLFQTRWAMNYLAGPLTRVQIPALNRLAAAPPPTAPQPASQPVAQPAPSADQFQATPLPSSASDQPPSATRPTLPAGVKEFFLPNTVTFTQAFKAAGKSYPVEAISEGLVYRPAILAQAHIRFLNRRYNLDYTQARCVLVQTPDRRGLVRWENHSFPPVEPTALDDAPAAGARFATPQAPFTEARSLSALQKDFLDWVYRTATIAVRAHEGLKLYAGPQVSPAEFRTLISEAARSGRDAETRKASTALDRKLDTLKARLSREQRELSEDETELAQRKMEEVGTHAENIFSLFSRRSRRTLSTSLTKRRLTEQAKAEVDESLEAIADLEAQIAALEAERSRALAEANEAWGSIASQVTEITVPALKKDILLEIFGVAWAPYHVIRLGEETIELPGFSVQ